MNKNNVIESWSPIDLQSKSLYFVSLLDGQDGLQIHFEMEDFDSFVVLDFGYHAIYFQSQDENGSLRIIDELGLRSMDGPFYILNNSNLINMVAHNSYGFIEKARLIHFILFHTDGLLDILSSKEPKVYFKSFK